jgi:hypothetical protein
MSRSYEYSYALEAARRRQLYLNRITATTEQFYHRYEQKYKEMENQGFSAYIPAEMRRLESDLARIRELLSSDPEEARETSYKVGEYIRNMSSLAFEARKQFEYTEHIRVETLRLAKKQQQSELIKEYFKILQTISNPIVVNFSISEMQRIKNDIESFKLTNLNELKQKTDFIISNAESKATEWKENSIKKNYQKNASQAITEAEERIKSEQIENKEKTQKFIEKINKLRDGLAAGTIDTKIVEKQVVELENEVDEALISEDTRRETVLAIIKQLKGQEFTVEKPQLIQTNGKDYVKIVAKKPSGKRAICNVDLYGKIAYKFDNYMGMTCLKDIEKFNVELEQIYSVKLSDERVLWENPDKLSMDANSLPSSKGRKI